LTAGTRRNGTNKVGPFTRTTQDGPRAEADARAERYTGRHTDPRGKTARKRARKVVPAAGVAAALVAGAAAYGLVGTGGNPQAGQLSTDLAMPVSLSSATHGGAGIGVGGVNSAASAMITAARHASGAVASAAAKSRASKPATPAATPSASPSASADHSESAEAGTATPTASATPSATSTQSSSGGSAAVATDIANGNYTLAIGQYLVDHGYTAAAAAGVASCVDGESGANPESEGDGGGGLIGWTPLGSAEPDGNIITGDVSADMMTQLADILYYNADEIGQSAVDELNNETDPVAAADFFSQNFEKPAVTDSDVVPSVAEKVYSELGG
jgi:hypothetical protein